MKKFYSIHFNNDFKPLYFLLTRFPSPLKATKIVNRPKFILHGCISTARGTSKSRLASINSKADCAMISTLRVKYIKLYYTRIIYLYIFIFLSRKTIFHRHQINQTKESKSSCAHVYSFKRNTDQVLEFCLFFFS